MAEPSALDVVPNEVLERILACLEWYSELLVASLCAASAWRRD